MGSDAVSLVFYISGAVALAATLMVVTRTNAVHAALYLLVSLLAVALVFFSLGAPFVAALEIVVYAGAIMVLFVFVIMMLNLGSAGDREGAWLRGRVWIGPALLALILAAELVYVLAGHAAAPAGECMVGPQAVARSLFGPYVLAVELASFLLLAGLVGAYHLGTGDPGASGAPSRSNTPGGSRISSASGAPSGSGTTNASGTWSRSGPLSGSGTPSGSGDSTHRNREGA